MYKQVSGQAVSLCPNSLERPLSGISDQRALPPLKTVRDFRSVLTLVRTREPYLSHPENENLAGLGKRGELVCGDQICTPLRVPSS